MPSQPEPPTPDAQGPRPPAPSILGLSTESLAGLSVDELCQNKTAITMVMHYYKQLVDINLSLQNQVNTYKTYVDAYNNKQRYSVIAGALLVASNIGVGFGVNLLTSGQTWPGIATMVPALAFAAIGLYFSFRSDTST